MNDEGLRRAALDDPRTECTHRDERGSTVMHVRDDRYECAVCGERFTLIQAALAARSEPRGDGVNDAVCAVCGRDIFRPWIDGVQEPWKHWVESVPDGHKATPEPRGEGLRVAIEVMWDNHEDAADHCGYSERSFQRDIAAVIEAATPPAPALDGMSDIRAQVEGLRANPPTPEGMLWNAAIDAVLELLAPERQEEK